MQSYTRRSNIPNRLTKRPKTLSRSQVKTSVCDSIMIPKRLNPKESALVYTHNIFPVAFLRHLSLSLVPGIRTPPKSKNVFCYTSSPSICGPSFLLSGLAWWQSQEKTTREREREMCFVSLSSNAQYVSVSHVRKIPYPLFLLYLFFWRRERQKKTYFLDFVCVFLFLCRKPETRRLANYKLTQQRNGIRSAASL